MHDFTPPPLHGAFRDVTNRGMQMVSSKVFQDSVIFVVFSPFERGLK